MRILVLAVLCIAASLTPGAAFAGAQGSAAAASITLPAGSAKTPAGITGTPAGPVDTDVIPVLSDMAARMTVAVHVNGAGPFPFIVDTGADRTVISRELAERLNLPKGPGAVLHDTIGINRVDTALIDSLVFGRREVNGIKAALLTEANLGASGILGIDSLHDQRVLIDFARELITIEPSETEPDREPDEIVVRAKRRFGQLILVDASAGSVKVNVILDSGAQTSIGNNALRRLLGRSGYLPKPVQTSILSVTGRTLPAEFIPIAEVTLGGVSIRNIPIAFANLHTFAQFGLARKPAMLLGMDVLRQFDFVSVDFEHKKVRLLLPRRH